MRRITLLLIAFAVAAFASAATRLEVVLPSHVTNAVPFSFTVTARTDADLDPSYRGTIAFSGNSAALPADYTFTAADNGSHTFTATFYNDGAANETKPITAYQTPGHVITGTGTTIVEWDPNVVRFLRLTMPDTIERDQPVQGTVTARNNQGDIVPGYRGTVQFDSDSADVPPDYTFTAADNGSHTFTFVPRRGGYILIHVHQDTDLHISGYAHPDVTCSDLTVTAQNSGPMCPGGTAMLSATSNQPDIEYYWSGPAIFESSQPSPTVTQPGVYHLLAKTANGCESSSTTTVTVSHIETPTVSLGTNVLCSSSSTTATVTNASLFTDYRWDASPGIIVSGQGTTTVEVAPYLGQTIVLNLDAIYLPTGCRTQYHEVGRVSVGEPVDATITTPASICPSMTEDASVPSNAMPGATYAWSITHGVITSGQGTHAIRYRPDGTEAVTLSATVTNADCNATGTAVVNVDGPTGHADAHVTICPGESATIPVTLEGTAPFRIEWSDGVVQSDVNTTTTSRSVSPEHATSYAIVSVSDANCSGTGSGEAIVEVADGPQIVTQPHNTSIMRGARATLTVEAAGSQLFYDWYQGTTGDRSHRVAASASPSYTTPELEQTTSYWVEIESACGTAQSHTAVVSVGTRHRSVRH
jgi:hypothetical protein